MSVLNTEVGTIRYRDRYLPPLVRNSYLKLISYEIRKPTLSVPSRPTWDNYFTEGVARGPVIFETWSREQKGVSNLIKCSFLYFIYLSF